MYSFPRDVILNTKIEDLMVSSDKVAHVQIDNPLEHALLVLIKSGYSAVPVLDLSYRLRGIISTTMIMDTVLGIESFEMEKLTKLKVAEVMNPNVPKLKLDADFMRALGLTINHPFVCIEDNEGLFKGILTRRAIIKLFTKNLHK
ncbi:cyclic-di-AMP-binding protein CbpB [Calidifontibacillus erzurumensis]|uniref:CBS domain-containing protein n=1 Tax=Calidifontibacillus erzurumensis TaxID=2741433 RepID=A0A8J8GBE9_9BACI|nr:cyclic-di-AMP-binding protein CbpB [Calidifontibacillus erzurumensis]NSL50704.1 CBS domain-containing protein [Calidifontibacillus erzurumensis]